MARILPYNKRGIAFDLILINILSLCSTDAVIVLFLFSSILFIIFFFLSFPFTFFLLFFVLFCNFASSVCDCQFNEFPPCLPDKPLHRSQTPLHHHPLIVLMRHTHTLCLHIWPYNFFYPKHSICI